MTKMIINNMINSDNKRRYDGTSLEVHALESRLGGGRRHSR